MLDTDRHRGGEGALLVADLLHFLLLLGNVSLGFKILNTLGPENLLYLLANGMEGMVD